MFDYVKLFQEKAGSIEGTKKPNRPALLLYIGDLAVRSRKQLLPKLLSQIPEAYHGALVEGALCSDSEADDLAYLPIPDCSNNSQFGQFAKEWLDEPDHQISLEQFLGERIHQTTIANVAVAMGELDFYLIVGNDGGACELLPSVIATTQKQHVGTVVRWHVVWLYREMYTQTRDAAMCGLLNAIEQKDKTIPEVQALPEGECLIDAMPSITLISDRNLAHICSESVWDNNCCGISGYILANLFGSKPLPSFNTCAMYDSIYPDMFWSAGFQLSLLLKLKESLIVQQQKALDSFLPKLASAWGCTVSAATRLELTSLLAKLETALPAPEDLLLIPVNPEVSKQQIKNTRELNSSISLLYGKRFQRFFDDALENPSLKQLEKDMTDAFLQTLQEHCEMSGVYATAELLNTETGLPHYFSQLCEQTAYSAKAGTAELPKIGLFGDPIADRCEDIYNFYGKEKVNELKWKAVRHLLTALCAKMKQLQPEYEKQVAALGKAITVMENQLLLTLGSHQTSYTHQIESLAKNKSLYATTVDAGEMAILNRYFMVEQPEKSLMKALTEMNLRENELITTPLQKAFTLVQYTNGENELRSTLDRLCSAAIHTPALLTPCDIYILPGGGDWSNGTNVYGLIRIYASNSASLITSSPYMSTLLNRSNRTVLLPGSPKLPPLQPETTDVLEKTESVINVETAVEEQKVLGSLKYSHPNTLVRFNWPERNVNVLELGINGVTDCGKNQYCNTLHVSTDSYVKNGGALLNNVRLTGNCEATLTWRYNGELMSVQGTLTGEPIHVSRIIKPDQKDYVFHIKTNDNITDLHSYLLMRVRKPNGVVVDYRLPELKNDEFRIPQKGCTTFPEIVLASDDLCEYISF